MLGSSTYDYCLRVETDNNITIYILLYVDDLFKDIQVMNYVKRQLHNKLKEFERSLRSFKMKDLNKVKIYIGIVSVIMRNIIP